jgi:hypothetical protein
MKSPWQFGLLAVAVMGVSTYDYVFFTNSNSPNHESGLIQKTPFSGAMPLLSPPAASEAANGFPALPISPEALHLRSQQAYVASKSTEQKLEGSWPQRDPFKTEETPIMAVRRPPPEPAAFSVPRTQPAAPSAALTERAALSAPPTEPQCLFSGTLIEPGRRLALVNGMPLSIGDRLGDWKLSRIETEYIILEAGKETRRIEQRSGKPPVSLRKEPQ